MCSHMWHWWHFSAHFSFCLLIINDTHTQRPWELRLVRFSSCTFRCLQWVSNVTHLGFYLTCWIYTPPSGLHELKRDSLRLESQTLRHDESRAAFSCSVTYQWRKDVKLLVMEWFVLGPAWKCKWLSIDLDGGKAQNAPHFRCSQAIFTWSILQSVHGIFSCSHRCDVKQTHLTVKVGFLICIFTEIIILVSISYDFIICN